MYFLHPWLILKELLIECIIKLQNIDLKVVSESGIVCGMGCNNIILANQLGITQEIFFTINDANIFFIYAVPHIFKALRF